ncbi:MAG: LPS-assembly protein LptD [Deltaproteobacteria bacterium]|nr:MAG: LPS-assembly protein LptD [Deltaproteobacteria bacterium]
MRKTNIILGLQLLAALLSPYNLPAQSQAEPEPVVASSKEPAGWRLRADHFTHDPRQGVYTARGNVSLRSPEQLITADEMRLDSLGRQAILEGRVRIEQGRDWLEAERAVLDLQEQTGTIEHGRGFLAENNFYFSGALIEKLGPQTYHVEQAHFTTCDGIDPSWHFRASDLRVTVDGYGVARNGRFHVGRVPLLYSPYLPFPARTTRQSGFLPPLVGSSSLLGFDLDLPFFWAISESTDATFFAHYMSKRGLMAGAEFRYAASRDGKGVLRFDYLDDQEDTESLRQQGFRQVEPGFSGEYFQRWWWRSKQDFGLPHSIQGKLDLDVVSDRDYLREFETGFSSWQDSDRVFQATFGRGLINDESGEVRESTLLVTKNWAAHSLNGDFHYFQDLNSISEKTTLQQLPLIDYSATRQPLLGGPFFVDGNVVFVNYWRPEGTRGQRLEIFPRLGLPMRFAKYIEFEPSVGFSETLYLTQRFQEPPGSSVEEKTFQTRELFDVRAEAATEFLRIFGKGEPGSSKTKHILRPEIVYEYVPKVTQEQLPFYDSTDRISNRSRLTYSLTNFFSARLQRKPGEFGYRQFGRLKFSQSYDLEEPEGLIDPATSEGRPFSNLFTQLDLIPLRYVNLTYKNEWNPYDGDFKLNDLFATLWDRRGDTVTVNYRHVRDEDGQTTLNEIDGWITVKLWGGVSFVVRNNYSFSLQENLETDYRIQLIRQCWGMSFSYVDQPNDRRFMVGFTLFGLGELRPTTIPLSF